MFGLTFLVTIRVERPSLISTPGAAFLFRGIIASRLATRRRTGPSDRMAARALPLHNVNGPPHDIAAVATDGDLKRRGCGCRLVHSNSILLSRGPEGFGLSLQDIATFTADALRGQS